MFPDEDDEGERNSVPLSSLSSFYTEDSLKQQKKKKNKKIKEGKLSKVMKRKKEVSCSELTLSDVSLDVPAWQQSFSCFSGDVLVFNLSGSG